MVKGSEPSGKGSGCMGGAWTGGSNGETTRGGSVESEHGADASETHDGQRLASNSGVKVTASGIAGGSDGACGMSRDCRALGASIRAAVGKPVAGTATGDLVGHGWLDRAASGEASVGGKSCRATEARHGDKGTMGAAGSRAGCGVKGTEIGSHEAGRDTTWGNWSVTFLGVRQCSSPYLGVLWHIALNQLYSVDVLLCA